MASQQFLLCSLVLLLLAATSVSIRPVPHNEYSASNSNNFHEFSASTTTLPKIYQSVTVSKRGGGNFSTIAEAVKMAPNNTDPLKGYFAIFVGEGIYNEYIKISKETKNLLLVGAGINRTVITGNRSVGSNWPTFQSATFEVQGPGFIAKDMTFENTAGPENGQAVAVLNTADTSVFYRCSFLGYQDTLYAHSQRQFYRECDIYGTVDFIFGNATAVFQNCGVYARKPKPGQANMITAQSRTGSDQGSGYSFLNCSIKAAPDLAADPNSAKSYLGRPWKDFSRVVYMQSFIDRLVDPAGWSEWEGGNASAAVTVYYGEFENRGPGADVRRRIRWPGHHNMESSEALQFTLYNFTGGQTWVPATGVPHFGGLI